MNRLSVLKHDSLLPSSEEFITRHDFELNDTTQRYWVFGLRPSSGFFLNNNEKHNVSETGSVSVLR
jgi:hypothetical protein